jgi:phosphate transport system permease protein
LASSLPSYLHEYTSPTSRTTRLIRTAINNLAGVPSIVFGLFGLGFFIGFIGHGIDTTLLGVEKPVWGQPAIIWAALTLALLTLPVVIVSTEEALRAIPRELKDASYALGATKLQTIVRIIIPQALPGIFTGAILAISRGAGEVAPIMFTGAAYYLPYLPWRLMTVYGTWLSCICNVHAVTRYRKDRRYFMEPSWRAGADVS